MFGLDPESIVGRIKASSHGVRVPTLGESVARGTIGFTIVSLGGFAPWMFAGRAFYRAVGEIGMYVACALVFVVLSGALLRRLIIGPESFGRFYKVFTLSFLAYSVAWTIGWMTFHGNIGSVVGLLAGAAVMGFFLTSAFAARDAVLKIIIVLFASNTAGYFVGGWAHTAVLQMDDFNALGILFDRPARVMLSKAMWGLFYGLGFGAGIGFAFHSCQAAARRLVAGLKSTEHLGEK